MWSDGHAKTPDLIIIQRVVHHTVLHETVAILKGIFHFLPQLRLFRTFGLSWSHVDSPTYSDILPLSGLR
jgi:hypothetical protein